MDRLLAQLQQEGALDSQGFFTLDPSRARELLRHFQLARPEHYVLNLVSFLVGSGARGITVTTGPKRLTIRAVGAVVDATLLANPLAGLFAHSQGRALGELAIGVNSALGLPGATVVVRSWDGKIGLAGHYQQESFQTENWHPEDTTPAIVVEVSHQIQSRYFEEAEALRSWFEHCPIPIELDGEDITRPLGGPQGAFLYLDFDSDQKPVPGLRVET
ncbi:MAG: hypothetical protein KC910_37210, partial [Candidatus Eremiobacteraeota bacterium]|nr:hypothetical protein [Candidatus Eremiobacteraeota bacterium]